MDRDEILRLHAFQLAQNHVYNTDGLSYIFDNVYSLAERYYTGLKNLKEKED